MGLMDDAQKKLDEAKEDLTQKADKIDDTAHEKKGEVKGHADQARYDSNDM